jgi:hypothetical protein
VDITKEKNQNELFGDETKLIGDTYRSMEKELREIRNVIKHVN